MNQEQIKQKIQSNDLPLLVEIWAPWCMPCKSMEPYLQRLEQEYQGRIELLRINADQNPTLMRELKIFGVPTFIGYKDQKQIFRRTGFQSIQQLQDLAEVLLGNRTSLPFPSFTDRMVRSIAGLAFIWLGWEISHSWIWIGIGALLIFSAFYDRCPIIQALMSQRKRKNL